MHTVVDESALYASIPQPESSILVFDDVIGEAVFVGRSAKRRTAKTLRAGQDCHIPLS